MHPFVEKIKQFVNSYNWRKYKRYLIWHLGIFLAIIVVGIIYLSIVVAKLPDFKRLENPEATRLERSSIIYSADGKILGEFYVKQNRMDVPLEKISKNVINALIATEDVRFYKHNGLDFWGIMSVFYSRLIGQSQRGGSTITQQLARNLYDEEVGRERTVSRKIKEAIVAVFLEKNYTKEEILNFYLNTVSFGGIIYGIEAAARYYFGKSASELTPDEAATLIGMLKGPSLYNPKRHPKRAQKRRNIVLNQMLKYGFISEKEYKKYSKIPLAEKVKKHTKYLHAEGPAPYFREILRKFLYQWAKKKGYNLYKDGLRIYTTIDYTLQEFAEKAVEKHLREYQKLFEKQFQNKKVKPWEKEEVLLRAMKRSYRYISYKKQGLSEKEILKKFKTTKITVEVFDWEAPEKRREVTFTPWDSLKHYAKFMETGLVTIEPYSGKILAWVGGIDYRFFKYDHVKQGKRQVGSTFKPFVYAAALDNGYTPCTKVPNIPITILMDSTMTDSAEARYWSPKNADGKIGGELTLKDALAHSVNIVTARLIYDIGPKTVVDYAHRMGIKTKLHRVPSIGLGTIDLSVYELTSAYATFANSGKYIEPVFITKIEDKHGNVVEDFTVKQKRREAINKKLAYTMIEMLRNVARRGTGSSVYWKYKVPRYVDIGCKTGTTQKHADGWFMGITPHFATGVWVGWQDRNIHFPTLTYGQGARMALPIWAIYKKQVYTEHPLYSKNEVKKQPFSPPPDFDPSLFDCENAQNDSTANSSEEEDLPFDEF